MNIHHSLLGALILILSLALCSNIMFNTKLVMGVMSQEVSHAFFLNWNSTLLRISFTYNNTIVAGKALPMHIQVDLLDLGDNERVRLNYVKLRVSDTAISAMISPMDELDDEHRHLEYSIILMMKDPAFRDIPQGDYRKYDVLVTVGGTAWSSSSNSLDLTNDVQMPVYVYSPEVRISFDVQLPDGVIAEEEFPIVLNITNIGQYAVYDLRVKIASGDLEIYGENERLLGSLLPKESSLVSFRCKYDDMGSHVMKIYLIYRNSAGYNLSSSYSRLINVKGLSKITITCNVSNGYITLAGWLHPLRVNVPVSIQLYENGMWKTLATVRTDKGGLFKYLWKAPQKGTYSFRAYWSGDEDYVGSSSPIINMTLDREPTQLYIVADKLKVKKGEEVTIKGYISPSPGDNAVVNILFRTEEGEWGPLGVVILKNASFTYSWSPEEEGTYYIKAQWSGDLNFYGSGSNTLIITVTSAGISFELLLKILLTLAVVVIVVLLISVVRLRGKR